MRLTGSVPVLGCNNLEACLAFYRSALQFVIINQRKSEHGVEWAYLASGGSTLMLEKIDTTLDAAASNGQRLYFYCDDVKSLQHFLRAGGYAVSDLRTTPYGTREFDINDPDGHRLSVGENKK